MTREKDKLPERNPNLEYPDPTPVHIPGKTDKEPPLTLREEMRRYIREQISTAAAAADHGSFQDEDDFEEEDPTPDLTSPYTVRQMQPEPLSSPNDLEGDPEAPEPVITSPGEPGAAGAPAAAPSPPPEPSPEP